MEERIHSQVSPRIHTKCKGQEIEIEGDKKKKQQKKKEEKSEKKKKHRPRHKIGQTRKYYSLGNK